MSTGIFPDFYVWKAAFATISLKASIHNMQTPFLFSLADPFLYYWEQYSGRI